jgi:hypothetical protein
MKFLDWLLFAWLVLVTPRKSKGMTPLINLFIGFAAIVVVLEVVILLAGVITGLTGSMWTALNGSGTINGTWVVLMDSAVSVIQSSIQVGTLGILIYAFMAVLSAFGMFGAGGRR